VRRAKKGGLESLSHAGLQLVSFLMSSRSHSSPNLDSFSPQFDHACVNFFFESDYYFEFFALSLSHIRLIQNCVEVAKCCASEKIKLHMIDR
jgi:hypothetical protein